YLTDGDEAHLAYQFALPPLVLDALLNGDCSTLRDWAARLPTLPAGCHFLNFTASHDGIGLRAVEEILSPEAIQTLVDVA
ncbi:alpha-amylase, partial [Enterococcus hirae]